MQKQKDQIENKKVAQQIVPGDYLMISNQPCKVTETHHSKPGKHIMKASIQGRNLFTQRKMECLQKFTEPIQMIEPHFQEVQILDINEDWFATILVGDKAIKEVKIVDLDDVRSDIRKAFNESQQKQTILYGKIVRVKDREEIVGFRVQQGN